MDTTFIYGLNDPETGECRYVGKADDPKEALSRHLRDGRLKKKTHKSNWIQSLFDRNLSPILEILQEVPETEWELWERVWIKASREIGMNLTNFAAGGEGTSFPGKLNPMFGRKHSPETCAKISAAISGEKHEQFGKRGEQARRFGCKDSPETRAKKSAAKKGVKHSPEHVEKSAASRRGKPQRQNYAEGRNKPGWSSSEFRGVSKHKATGKWCARVNVNGKRIHLGVFLDEAEAARVCDTAAIKYFGPSCRLNFPD